MLGRGWPSVSTLAAPLVDDLVSQAQALRLGVQRHPSGAQIIDGGIDHIGSLEAGRRIAEICMAGLGQATLHMSARLSRWPATLSVSSDNPVLACLASQYAGWKLSHGAGEDAYFALGSGPARAQGSREELFDHLGYRDRGERACLVLEVDRMPPDELIGSIAQDCSVAPDALTLILTPTNSLCGGVQIAARVMEVALHKIHTLGFPLDRVVDGVGCAPLPPPSPDFLTAMGRTNDAILFGGEVHLMVAGPDDEARRLAETLPSRASRDYGRPFADVFRSHGSDFYEIDPMLFSPARVIITALDSGRTFHAGGLDETLIDRSFADGF